MLWLRQNMTLYQTIAKFFGNKNANKIRNKTKNYILKIPS